MNNQPIGIFDSGVGGTSIFSAIKNILPKEDYIYLADSKNAPYGEKSKDEIFTLSKKNTDFLINKGSKLIVVACNTATTNSIEKLRASYKIPFIGIEPAIKPAALQTKTKKIGILATKGTLSSELFHRTSNLYNEGISVREQIGEGLVSLIESGHLDSPETFKLLERYLYPMIEADIDHLVLGCTHYPYLIPMIRKIIPPHIKIIDSGEAVARQTNAVLIKNDLLSDRKENGSVEILSNGNPEILKELLPQFKKDIRFEEF
ncbi:glutamate racemase [Flavobacteriaceae bacterium MAR_2010_188]|nr:glutamate racemase [Flavobacteriaceae bacterium MAR_2010_188]